MDNSASARRLGGDHAPKEKFSTVMGSDSIKEEKEACSLADQCSEELRNTSCSAAEFSTVIVSDSIKEEREACSMADQCSEDVKNATFSAVDFSTVMVSDTIKEEREACSIADQCSEAVKNAFSAEEEFNIVIVSDSIKEEREACPIADQCSPEVNKAFFPTEFSKVMFSDSIKEERGACSMADQCSEEVKNATFSAEEEFNVVMVSDNIKEEKEACPIADQCSPQVKKAFFPAGMPGTGPLSSNVKEEACSMDCRDSDLKGNRSSLVGLPQDTTTSHSSQPHEDSTGAATTPTCTTNTIPVMSTPAATVVQEAAPARGRSATVEHTGHPPLRRRRRFRRAGLQAESGRPSTTNTEAQLLRGQRLQNNILGRISGVLHRFVRSNEASMQQLHSQLDVIGTNTGDLALSMRELVAGLLSQGEGGRRRDRQLLQRLDRMATSIGRLAVNTTGLSRRTVGLQVEMGHFAGDVARGLGRITHVIDLMEARHLSRGTGDTPQDSEEGSTVSSVSATDTRGLRSGSTRQSTAEQPGTSQAGRGRRRT
ncbi:uncharacterized protein [Pleurodeles waltl]|uniref:uncharacterized protein isoform X11 n=1 Tax=Pleurodeles waltl TaxID=8319 RepID=UPI003709424A